MNRYRSVSLFMSRRLPLTSFGQQPQSFRARTGSSQWKSRMHLTLRWPQVVGRPGRRWQLRIARSHSVGFVGGLAFYSAKGRPQLTTIFRVSACHSRGKYSSDTQFRSGDFGARRLISQILLWHHGKLFGLLCQDSTGACTKWRALCCP